MPLYIFFLYNLRLLPLSPSLPYLFHSWSSRSFVYPFKFSNKRLPICSSYHSFSRQTFWNSFNHEVYCIFLSDPFGNGFLLSRQHNCKSNSRRQSWGCLCLSSHGNSKRMVMSSQGSWLFWYFSNITWCIIGEGYQMLKRNLTQMLLDVLQRSHPRRRLLSREQSVDLMTFKPFTAHKPTPFTGWSVFSVPRILLKAVLMWFFCRVFSCHGTGITFICMRKPSEMSVATKEPSRKSFYVAL